MFTYIDFSDYMSLFSNGWHVLLSDNSTVMHDINGTLKKIIAVSYAVAVKLGTALNCDKTQKLYRFSQQHLFLLYQLLYIVEQRCFKVWFGDKA